MNEDCPVIFPAYPEPWRITQLACYLNGSVSDRLANPFAFNPWLSAVVGPVNDHVENSVHRVDQPGGLCPQG
jgi:hypothetical protein